MRWLPVLVPLLAAVVLGGEALALYADWLWFAEVRYTGVFLTTLAYRAVLFVAGAALAGGFLAATVWFARHRGAPDVLWELDNRLRLPAEVPVELLLGRVVPLVIGLAAFLEGLSAAGAWQSWLLYRHQVPFGATDPLFGRDVAFYVFTLPVARHVLSLGFRLVVMALLLSAAVHVLQGRIGLTPDGPRMTRGARTHLLVLGSLALVIQAIDFWLDRFELVLSPGGAIFGAGYADVHARLPVLGALAVIAAIAAVVCLLQVRARSLTLVSGALGVLAVVWVAGLGLYPALLQRLRVTPNELVAERPYIEHNIRMTRQAFDLERVEEREFPADEALDAATLERNAATIDNVRLWDHRPLLTTYAQLQEIRTYYKFADVDVDRYRLGDDYRQVMLSSRELSSAHLPGRNWINTHLTFTHGYGAVAGPVNRVSAQGLPEFLALDIPPRSSGGFPAIRRPAIYYGELSDEYAIVGTRSGELDYPSGDQNVYTRYSGAGGIPLAGLGRRLLFALRLAEPKLLLSDEVGDGSRILLHRQIGERVRRIAPFFRFDRDPYMVVTADGRLVWMIDAYTTADAYPYSDPVPGVGNYIRNPVKVTVDAYDGTVAFYVVDASEPIAAALGRALPGLLHPLSAMPETLRPHLRYPEDLFAVQAQKYATYHMQDPQVFYNREDMWAIPQRTVGGRQESMEPYYTIMKLPGEDREEFILLTLFNPARRDNMIAWMAARSDGEAYGRLIVFNFPKQKLVYGPRQIDARIDQDPVIARQLALWNQRGSAVIRGSLLAIPIEQSLIYVQPLFLAAAEQGALPELRRVIVAHGNDLAMEPTLEQSLAAIFGGPAAPPAPASRAAEDVPVGALGREAWEAWQRSQEALGRGDLAGYGAEQQRLEGLLRRMLEATR